MLLSPSENGRRQFIKKGGEEDGASRCRANIVTPYKKCNIIKMHSVHVTLLLREQRMCVSENGSVCA